MRALSPPGGRTGDAIFFMRAGFTGVSRYCPLLWAGDQSVDFSRHDGIGTVLRGALSSGILGNAYHHSDLGGYTSLFGNVRTAELLMRWSELAAFTPVMRSHEGNRPDENLQLDGEPDVLAQFVRMTQVHAALAPYVASLCDEAAASGLPLQRPMFVDYEDDAQCWALESQYCYGRDLLVAPVVEAGATDWKAYLPAGTAWIHLWSGERVLRRSECAGGGADGPAAGVLPGGERACGAVRFSGRAVFHGCETELAIAWMLARQNDGDFQTSFFWRRRQLKVPGNSLKSGDALFNHKLVHGYVHRDAELLEVRLPLRRPVGGVGPAQQVVPDILRLPDDHLEGHEANDVRDREGLVQGGQRGSAGATPRRRLRALPSPASCAARPRTR